MGKEQVVVITGARAASLVLNVLTSRSPRGRYLLGSHTKMASWLRMLARFFTKHSENNSDSWEHNWRLRKAGFRQSRQDLRTRIAMLLQKRRGGHPLDLGKL